MVLGVQYYIWGEKLEMPEIARYGIETYETSQIWTLLAEWKKAGVADAAVETYEGNILGVLLPNGQIFAFNPN